MICSSVKRWRGNLAPLAPVETGRAAHLARPSVPPERSVEISGKFLRTVAVVYAFVTAKHLIIRWWALACLLLCRTPSKAKMRLQRSAACC